ncbi:MAG: hypothetical protein WEA99_12705 [Brumimicrobium sp.]
MSKRFFLKDAQTQKTIEVFRSNSKREQLLIDCLAIPILIQSNITIVIDKEKLKKKLTELISNREVSRKIDFGNRFGYDLCYQKITFEGVDYELETSGDDNLIIFGFNIYNADNLRFLVKDK